MRAQGQPQIRGMTCSTNAYGITADFRLHNKAVKGWEFSKVRVLVAARVGTITAVHACLD